MKGYQSLITERDAASQKGAEQKDWRIADLRAQIAAVGATAQMEVTRINEAFEREIQERTIRLAADAHSKITPLLAAYFEEPSRLKARKLGEVLCQLNSAVQEALGHELGSNVVLLAAMGIKGRYDRSLFDASRPDTAGHAAYHFCQSAYSSNVNAMEHWLGVLEVAVQGGRQGIDSERRLHEAFMGCATRSDFVRVEEAFDRSERDRKQAEFEKAYVAPSPGPACDYNDRPIMGAVAESLVGNPYLGPLSRAVGRLVGGL